MQFGSCIKLLVGEPVLNEDSLQSVEQENFSDGTIAEYKLTF